MTETARPTAPIPGFLSEQAQAVLAARPDVRQYPDLEDTEGWLRMIAAADADSRRRPVALQRPVHSERREIAGVPIYVLHVDDVPDSGHTPVYLEIHGGALIYGGGELAAQSAARTATHSGLVHWAVDYRMPPQHPFPAALDDVAAVYRALLEQRDPADIVVGGASAGGNLAAAPALRANDEGLPMPAALVLLTPEVDLTESGDSFATVAAFDNTLATLRPVNLLYANGRDLADPYLSPLFGDLSGFPPTFVSAGTRDLFLSTPYGCTANSATPESPRSSTSSRRGRTVDSTAPEDIEVLTELRRFLDRHRRRP